MENSTKGEKEKGKERKVPGKSKRNKVCASSYAQIPPYGFLVMIK